MRFLVTVVPPVPAYIPEEHAGFGDYDFGVFRWIYQGFSGEIEKVNALKWMSEPKFPQPTSYLLWMAPGIQYTYEGSIILRSDLPSVRFFDIFFNPATGEGMPFNIP